ncbi:MAG: NAD-dependent epimerase/dehydratase family protein [Alphaproteobacteria bacterium]|nr:NAD-dependent epimerase/dehydratase family protein [Alphaproteobacteria bacterium]
MRIMVLGGDGYLGWPTAMYFSARGHEVAVVDNMIKRFWEQEVGVEPLIPVATLQHRIRRWREVTGKAIKLYVHDIATNPRALYKSFEDFLPEAIIHYAEQPSAPFSMVDREKCVSTQVNNVAGTLNVLFALRHIVPDAHIIKLGTMGEYGTPNIDIEEGWLDITHNGRKDRLLYPKKPGSFYHLSKVHDSHNLEFACRIWGCRVTDLNQGVVYGIDTDETRLDPEFNTSFHYDAVFGTVLNRFIVQAIHGLPLSVYGKGGQTRGFLNVRDTLACVELATLAPAAQGEFRVFNQFTEQFSVLDLAKRVERVAKSRGHVAKIENVPNPRVELEDHYYNAKHSALPALGLKPHLLTDEVVAHMMSVVEASQRRIDPDIVAPTVKWKQR